MPIPCSRPFMKARPERAATCELNRRRIGSASGGRFEKMSQDTKGPARLNSRWLRGCTSVKSLRHNEESRAYGEQNYAQSDARLTHMPVLGGDFAAGGHSSRDRENRFKASTNLAASNSGRD